MLDTFTLVTFEALVGTRFTVGDGPFALALTGVRRLAAANAVPGSRDPFALDLTGPAEPLLPQATYPLTHSVLGTFGLFIVPVARDGAGTRYEAIFT